MADSKTATAPVAEKNENPREEVSQTIRLIRFKLGQLAADAKRSRPFMSKSQDEAKARYDAALKTLNEVANFLDKEVSH